MVTAALPYANGLIHIGHLAGVYVPADIYVRYLRLKGEDVLFVCGSDEYGIPITLKAKQEGVSPQKIVDKYHSMNKDSFQKFGISFDIYSRTTSKVHYETASEFFKTLYNKGEFIEKTTAQYYDEEAGQFLADRYISGTCPHCDNENAYGDQCEKCGTSLSPAELINPKSTISGNKPVLKKTKHWFLPLDKYEPFLKKWILEEHKEWKTNVYGQCKSWLTQGLKPRAVSRDLDWGVPVPVKGAKGKVLYVWFDAPIGYISATKELTGDWEKYWKEPDTKLVHFIGKDNIVFHCIIFPSILKAEGSYILPDNVPANEFLNLESDKISTSRNRAVWLNEYLEDFSKKQDVLRYVLTSNAPETKDSDFTWKDFQARNNNELVAILGNFINRALVLTHKYFDGKVPEITKLNKYDKQAIDEIGVIKAKVENSLEHYRFREALKFAMDLARLGNKYLADTEPWITIKTDENRVKTIINISLQISANLSVLIEPFLPFTAEKICKLLNIKKLNWNITGNSIILAAGNKINNPELLFEIIEDKNVEEQINKLMETPALQKLQHQKSKNLAGGKKINEMENNTDVLKVKPLKENISFDDFLKLDTRVGTIIEAEKVPETNKLLKLTVDTGIDKRTVVAGIAEAYKPDEIIGKQVCILINLAPRKIRGIESQGMILMGVDTNEQLTFVIPEKKFQNGSEIR